MKITVIIPVYNAEKYLHRCLDSVINQTYTDWKIIAVNDGSSDSSLEILNKYASRDNRIKVYSQENSGAGMARNFAITKVNEKDSYIVFIDADDSIEPNYFELLSRHVEDVVFIDINQRDDISGKIIKKEKLSRYSKCSKDRILRMQMTGAIPWGGCRKASKASLIIDNDILYSNHKVGEEAIFSFKLLYFANTVSFIDETVYSYYIHEGSLSSTRMDDPWGKVVDNLKEEILRLGCYPEFATTLNSFYVSAVAVSLVRIAKFYSGTEYKKKAVDRIENYLSSVDKSVRIDKKFLNFKVRLFSVLINVKSLFLIKLASKLA